MADAPLYYDHKHAFPMHRGGELAGFRLAYETWGEPEADNVVVIFTGLSPGAHAASSAANPDPGWWEFMVGPGKAIDSTRWYVVCINSLGSCKGSTGPASIDPATGLPYATRFPALTLEDVANAGRLLLDHLGIDRIKILIGPSMGGMTALAFTLLHPGLAENMISISSAASAPPFAIAIRSLQRELIRRDPQYANGNYHDGPGPVDGMRAARKLGVISYRSAGEWQDRFGRDRIPPERASEAPFAPEFEIESYLEAHADRFVGGFDPNSYIYLSRAMDWFDAGQHRQNVDAALASTQLRSALVIGVETDLLFPLPLQQQIATGLAAGGTKLTFHRLASIQGHDAFLVDAARFSAAVAEYLADID